MVHVSYNLPNNKSQHCETLLTHHPRLGHWDSRVPGRGHYDPETRVFSTPWTLRGEQLLAFAGRLRTACDEQHTAQRLHADKEVQKNSFRRRLLRLQRI
eukprot:6203269-Pleurochrysis_carterae.AAC.2